MANIGGQDWKEIDWVVENAQKENANHFNRWCDWWDQQGTQNDMEREALKISTIRRKIGWTKDGHMKRIASMPYHVFMILRKIDQDFGRNTPEGKKKMYAFVMRHPQFSVK
jgi:hypothetical protein